MAKIAVIMFYTKGYSLGNYTHNINEKGKGWRLGRSG